MPPFLSSVFIQSTQIEEFYQVTSCSLEMRKLNR